MASSKRQNPDSCFPEAKRVKGDVPGSSEPEEKVRVLLNPADRNLDFNIEGGGLYGSALHDEGFAYCWSGARANVGIARGKYCFGCKIVSHQPVLMEDTPLGQQHISRIGVSRGDDYVGNLGETDHSYGFGGTGKFSYAGKFADYGERFDIGDTIVCAVDLECKASASIGFSKNGKWLGVARKFDAGLGGLEVVNSQLIKRPWEQAIFPHVLLKNVEVQMQFSIADGLVPVEGYKSWACASEEGNAIIGPSFSDSENCEVIMMVGLPASGKTTWAEKWSKEHPEKRYICLGTNLALEQMKVPGLLRRHNYGERFERLMDRATKIFNTLLSRAAKTPRNYILDQTNVYKSARKRKLKPFALYHKIAVVVFTEPEELKVRTQKRAQEMGKEVPMEAVNEMLANFVLPVSKDMPGADECFDVVMFPELNRDETQRYLDEMKRGLVSSATTARSEYPSFVQKSSAWLGPSISQQASAGSEHAFYRQPLHGRGATYVCGDNWQGFSVSHPQQGCRYQNSPLVRIPYRGPEQPGRLDPYAGSHYRSIDPSPGDNFPLTYSSDGGESLRRGDYNPLTLPGTEIGVRGFRGSVAPYQSRWMYGAYGEPMASRPPTALLDGHNGACLSNSGGSRAYFHHPLKLDFQPPLPGSYGSHYGTPTPSPALRYGNFARNGPGLRGSPYTQPRPR